MNDKNNKLLAAVNNLYDQLSAEQWEAYGESGAWEYLNGVYAKGEIIVLLQALYDKLTGGGEFKSNEISW